MKVKYNQPKNARIKKGTIKLKKTGRRTNFFCGLQMTYNPNKKEEHEIRYWCEGIQKWCTWDEWDEIGIGSLASSKYRFRSIRSVMRHLKKHSSYLPKGSVFELRSRWSDYEVRFII